MSKFKNIANKANTQNKENNENNKNKFFRMNFVVVVA